MHKILVIRLYLPLDALHVSDSLSPSSGAIFYKLYIAFGVCQYVRLLCGYNHTTAGRTGIYQMRCTAYKRLLLMMDEQSPKHVEHLMENKV